MICPYCKETILDGAVKCRFCGSFIPSGTLAQGLPADTVTPDEMRAFIGKNAPYYLENFAGFTRTGMEKFAPTWNWSCFCFTFFWMLYRKMYLASLVTFLIFCVPGVNLLLHIAAGVVGNFFYYRHVKDKIAELRTTNPPEQYLQLLPEAGGVHSWVIAWGIVVTAIAMILFVLFFATITASISKFSDIVI